MQAASPAVQQGPICRICDQYRKLRYSFRHIFKEETVYLWLQSYVSKSSFQKPHSLGHYDLMGVREYTQIFLAEVICLFTFMKFFSPILFFSSHKTTHPTSVGKPLQPVRWGFMTGQTGRPAPSPVKDKCRTTYQLQNLFH